MERSENLLLVDDIHTYYEDSYVLQGVSLDVPEGRIVALLGRNGMGKTTLIRSVAGLTPPRRGSVKFKDHVLGGLPPYKIAQLGIALVPQGRRIFCSLTVRENLQMPTSPLAGRKSSGNASKRRWDVTSILREFPQLEERLWHLGGTLSGGEQQMLAIGRALMANPELILMDEPSEGLAPVLVRQLKEIMQRLRQQGQSILLVEQNFGLAMSVADYVYVIALGSIVFHGTPDVLSNEKEVLDRHLGV